MPTRREARTSVLPGGQNLGAGGIQFRRADRGALCAPPVCSAGRRADEGIGPYERPGERVAKRNARKEELVKCVLAPR